MAPKDSKGEHEKKDPNQGSKESPKRRVNKPMIERRRRERINECLSQLQSLISQLDKDKAKIGKSSKLEKADILEMTVDFVKRSHCSAKEETLSSCQDGMKGQYMAGYQRCKQELEDFLHNVNTIPSDIKASLLHHVSSRVSNSKTPTSAIENIKPVNVSVEKSITTSYQSIQPKTTTATVNVVASATAATTNSTTQNGQKIIPSGGNIVLCNQEIPTFVLVPTATLCQPFPVTPQLSDIKSAPVTYNFDTTGTAKELKTTCTNDGSTIMMPSCGTVLNPGQVVVMSQNRMTNPQSIAISPGFQNVGTVSNINLNSSFGPILNVSGTNGPNPSEEKDVWRPW